MLIERKFSLLRQNEKLSFISEKLLERKEVARK
jgi:hypothetical protein